MIPIINRLLVFIESLARLLSKPTGVHHLPQPDRRPVLGISKPRVQHLHNAQARVQPNEVRQLQRAHRHVRPVLHDRVDAVPVADAGLQRDDRLVDVRHQDAVRQEARRVGRQRGNLAHALAELEGCRERRGRGLQAGDDLHALLDGHGVHEVRAEHAAAGGEVGGILARGGGDARDADGGGVGCEDGVGGADVGEVREDLELKV